MFLFPSCTSYNQLFFTFSSQCSPAFNMALDECLLNWQS
ncbi:octanoyltransferase, partial [Bacillus sp. D-CC]